MVDVVMFEECWYLVWWVGRTFISSSVMECDSVVSKSSSRSRLGSAPRRSTSESPPLKKMISASKILSNSSLFI